MARYLIEVEFPDHLDKQDLVDDIEAAWRDVEVIDCRTKLDAAPGRGECRRKVSVEAGRCTLNDGHAGNCKGEFVGPGVSP